MQVNSSSRAITVGTDSVIVSEAKISGNGQRVRLIVSNVSTGGQVVSLAVDGTPVAGSGIVMSPGGSMAWEQQGAIPLQQQRVLAIADLAGGSVAVYEEVLQ